MRITGDADHLRHKKAPGGSRLRAQFDITILPLVSDPAPLVLKGEQACCSGCQGRNILLAYAAVLDTRGVTFRCNLISPNCSE
jgi:hypothetical protein